MDLKKPFYVVPRSANGKKMIEIEMPLDYSAAVAQLYEQIRCHVKYILSNMASRKGAHSLPHYLVKEVGNKAAKEEGLDGPKIMHELTFILLYANNVI